jgi:hypothetical protein
MQLSAELPVNKVENIEITIDAARKQYKFGDIENLRGKKIRVIDFFRVTDVPVSPLANPLANDTVFNKSFLVLAIRGKEDINRVPLAVFNPKDNFGRRLLLNDVVVDWPKSFIEVGNTVGIVANETYFCNIYFE